MIRAQVMEYDNLHILNSNLPLTVYHLEQVTGL